MTLYFKCFFCGRTVTAFRDKKFVDCPECGARVDVDPDMATSSALSTSGSSCGCFVIIALIISIIAAIIITKPQKSKTRRYRKSYKSRKYRKKSRKRYAKKIFRLGTQQQIIKINKIVKQKLKADEGKRLSLFKLPSSWYDKHKLQGNLKVLFKSNERLYRAYSRGRLSKFTYGIWTSLKHFKFANLKDFEEKVRVRYQQLIKDLKKDNGSRRRLNAALLGRHLLFNIKSKRFDRSKSLHDIVFANQFGKNALLFMHEAKRSLYWNWKIGLHYGFSQKKISELASNDIVIWEKIPTIIEKEKYHWVILRNGLRRQWTQKALYRKVQK